MKLKNALTQEEVNRSALGRAVVETGDEQQAELIRMVFCCPKEDAATRQDGGGGHDDA